MQATTEHASHDKNVSQTASYKRTWKMSRIGTGTICTRSTVNLCVRITSLPARFSSRLMSRRVILEYIEI
jgi:hypothetical protein